jgi:hypothetical protein
LVGAPERADRLKTSSQFPEQQSLTQTVTFPSQSLNSFHFPPQSSKLAKLYSDPPRIEAAFRKHCHRAKNHKKIKKDKVDEGKRRGESKDLTM